MQHGPFRFEVGVPQIDTGFDFRFTLALFDFNDTVNVWPQDFDRIGTVEFLLV